MAVVAGCCLPTCRQLRLQVPVSRVRRLIPSTEQNTLHQLRVSGEPVIQINVPSVQCLNFSRGFTTKLNLASRRR